MIICCLTYIHMVNKKINNIYLLGCNTIPDAACPPVIDTLTTLCACKQRARWGSDWHLWPRGGGRVSARRDLPWCKPEHLPGVANRTQSKVRAAVRIFHTFPWENKASRNKLSVPHCKHTPACEQASLTPSTHTTFGYNIHYSHFTCFHSEINGKEEWTRLFMHSKDSSIKPQRGKE